MKPNLDKILNAVIQYHNSNLATFLDPSQKREIVNMRHLYGYLATKVYGYSQADAGKLIRKDHATILNSRDRIAGFLTYDKEIKKAVDSIKKIIENMQTVNFFGFPLTIKIKPELFEEIKGYQSFDEFCQVRGYFPMYSPVYFDGISGFKGYIYRDFMTKSDEMLCTDLCVTPDICRAETADLILKDLEKRQ